MVSTPPPPQAEYQHHRVYAHPALCVRVHTRTREHLGLNVGYELLVSAFHNLLPSVFSVIDYGLLNLQAHI